VTGIITAAKNSPRSRKAGVNFAGLQLIDAAPLRALAKSTASRAVIGTCVFIRRLCYQLPQQPVFMGARGVSLGRNKASYILTLPWIVTSSESRYLWWVLDRKQKCLASRPFSLSTARYALGPAIAMSVSRLFFAGFPVVLPLAQSLNCFANFPRATQPTPRRDHRERRPARQ